MARRRVEPTGYRYDSWDEVDEAMRELCVKAREGELITHAMNERIDAEKQAADEQMRPIRAEVAKIEAGIQNFATEHREDMGRFKSRKLNFGTVYFRKSTKIKVPTAKEKLKQIIERLRSRGMTDCISQPEPRVNKDVLRTYGPEIIVEVGASIEVDDVFSYELDQTRIEQ